jgi:hypothetical protein
MLHAACGHAAVNVIASTTADLPSACSAVAAELLVEAFQPFGRLQSVKSLHEQGRWQTVAGVLCSDEVETFATLSRYLPTCAEHGRTHGCYATAQQQSTCASLCRA